ncbi:MAG: transglycosylase domain-containing protein [Bacteroidales bacterium]|nr:transglycosylase domain-containing protein [Bacteroidales bacterium]
MNENTQKKISKVLWIIALCPVVILPLALLIVAATAKIPSFEELERPEKKLATQLIAEGGEVLATYHIENRSYVSYDELSPYLVEAAVSTEDVRFYKHSGIDFKGLARVAVKTILLNGNQGGGSTITQQLAKTLYPRGKKVNKIKLVGIKLKEWITAVKLEKNYTKDEIMLMYLNSVEYSFSSFGVKAAAQTFYAKQPRDLTVEEAAMLVGMVNGPTRWNPVRNPEKAMFRRNTVLNRMYKADRLYHEDGTKYTRKQLDSLKAIPVDCPEFAVLDHNAGRALYFRDMIRRTMNATEPKRSDYDYIEVYRADSLRWANDDLYGWLNKYTKADGSRYNLDKDGLRIYTTINYKMQKYAEEAVAEHLGKDLQNDFWRDLRHKTNAPFSNDVTASTRNSLMNQARKSSDRYRALKREGASDSEIKKVFDTPCKMRVFSWKNAKGYIDTTMTPNDSIIYYKSHLRTGFVAIEPVTGRVKAYVGGPNYRYFKYDNCTQSTHQVGSTIKPFLYTLAMQNGMNPCTQVINLPQTFVDPFGNEWTPRSTDKEEWIGKTVTLKWGLTMSSNNISAYLMKQFGPVAMASLMHKCGIRNHLDEVNALCVGAADLTVMEMVSGYTMFPGGGVSAEPLMVTRIEDSMGNVITEFSGRSKVVINPYEAGLMVNLMQGVVNGGTAARLRGKYALKGQIAGKTGTTNNNSDGWFIGYTPKICAGAWVGGENPQIHFQSIVYGGGSNMALPIWGIWMKKVLADGTLGISESDEFSLPEGIGAMFVCTGGDSDAREGGESSEEEYFD